MGGAVLRRSQGRQRGDAALQITQTALKAADQTGQSRVVAGTHQGRVLGELNRVAFAQNFTDKLGAEIVMLPPIGNAELAQEQSQNVEVVVLLPVHDGLHFAQCRVIALILNLQFVQHTGRLGMAAVVAAAEMLPAGPCREYCGAVFAGGAVQQLQMDSIVRQANELGTYMFLFTGGEPLVRKKDIIRLCEERRAALGRCACAGLRAPPGGAAGRLPDVCIQAIGFAGPSALLPTAGRQRIGTAGGHRHRTV